MEPTKQEKKFLAQAETRETIKKIQMEYTAEEKRREQAKVKDLWCMGIKTKLAKGPNPLSIRKKVISKKDNGKKRRPRKGVRSRELSAKKKEESKVINEQN